MELASHRLSYATWRLRAFHQLLTSESQPRPFRRSISTSAPRSKEHDEAPSQTPQSSNSSEDYIPPSQRLPQSPVITHPRSGITKVRKRRPQPKDLSDLSKNPWAVALASPIRMCSATGLRVPRALMGEYGLVRRPDSELSYMLPVDLLKDTLRKQPAVPETSTAPDTDAMHDGKSNTKKGKRGNISHQVPRDEKLSKLLTIRMINLLPLLQALSSHLAARVGKRLGVSKIIPYRWKYPLGPLTSNDIKEIMWMQDMPEYLLRRMRQDVIKKLVGISEFYELDANDVWRTLDLNEYSGLAIETALGKLEPVAREAYGGVLLLGPPKARTTRKSSFLEDVVHPRTQTKLPVFDLSAFLTAEGMEELRVTHAPHFQASALFLRPDCGASVDLMISLWKIKRYLADMA
ncbi:hypothetical protein N7532_001901 [Penicillium argentinense]|uniref:Uncharacterized protein n=1 Tax=Penicillium argentinense TaxID=1131581 RepID=A0A9W9G3M6_9EURO|nr:uncharacterized protein N7532_001901 [Penicillium argentinense]KAJ5111366.1 hypothetical protein N7532_001901 [Penicillium argentinense]